MMTTTHLPLLLLLLFLEDVLSFFFLGYYYRPASLKSMAVLLGNSEKRSVYKNFDLQNLHHNLQDPTHLQYMSYLENSYFIPPHERKYWAHMVSNVLPVAADTTIDKGLFNVFPLDLVPLDMTKNPASASLGM